jgi:LysM repeat protein
VSAIVAANHLNSRALIRVGQVLSIPGRAPAAAPAAAAPVLTHTVRAGETVSHIALRTGTSVAAIVAANHLNSRALIRVGQVLTIPSGGSTAESAATTPAPANATYTVKSGDTMSHIAARTGYSLSDVLALNGLSRSSTIYPGQTIKLPGAPAPTPGAPAAPARTTDDTVRSGDTLSEIAVRAGTSVAALRAANPGLDSRGTIRIGQTLQLPKPAAPMPNSFAGRTYPDSTVQAATRNRDVLAARSVPSRSQMQQIIASTARHWGVDPALAQAVAFQESGFNMRAVSPANAVGAMQVIPSSGRWASDLAGRHLDLLDPQDNATAGVVILRALTRAEDDQATAIAGYYQGLASVRRNGMYSDTRRYVANVQTLMSRFR